MTHLPDFITDLAIILITAGIATILFKWLKQPVVLGYILAGFLAGPFVTFLPTVTDMGNVEVWAEIGVIFLLFALGLEFSFKRLVDVGGMATIATLINLGSMIVIGYLVGTFMGWSKVDSIFLGGMLSMSSTTIIIKAFNDMGLQKQKFAGIVFGMLIVEDLAAILMMVVISTIVVSHNIEGTALAGTLLKLLLFVPLWFIAGIYLIPTILKRIKRYLNDETLLIIAAGLCLCMVLLSSRVGFSSALGAFIMGSILAETVVSKQVEHLTEPIKNLFGAVFFVSVGMMLNPEIIREYAGPIFILVAVVLVGRILFATIGVLASGEGLKVALQSGFSLAQIGEFSFIIASLGTGLGIISEKLYPIIVSVSIITTFTTPYCIRLSLPLYGFLEKRIPGRWHKLLTGYSSSTYETVNVQNDWNKLLKSVLRLLAVYSAISVAIVFLGERFSTPFITKHIPGTGGLILSAVIILLLMGPFLRAIVMKKNRSEEFKSLWKDNHFNRGALVSLITFRIILCVALVSWVLVPLFPRWTVLMIGIGIAVTALLILSRGIKSQSRRMEARFLENLHHKQHVEEKKAAIPSRIKHHLLLKEIHIKEIDISPDSPKIGKTLRDLDFRKSTGVSVVTILRGNRKINIPDAGEMLFPYDRIVVAGSDENIRKLMDTIAKRKSQAREDEPGTAQHHVSLSQYVVGENSPAIGKTVAGLCLQERTECMIVNVDRDNRSVRYSSPQFTFRQGDILLLAGEKDKLCSFEKNVGNP